MSKAFAAQANSRSDVKARSAGRSHKRATEQDKDWKREQGRLLKEKAR